MTETHEIRSPEWSHIHERDNRIIELEAEVERLRRYPIAIQQLREKQFTDQRICDDIERLVHEAAGAAEGSDA